MNATGRTPRYRSPFYSDYCSFLCFHPIVHLNSLWIWKNQSRPTACQQLICCIHFHLFENEKNEDECNKHWTTHTLKQNRFEFQIDKDNKMRNAGLISILNGSLFLEIQISSKQKSRKPQNQSTLIRFSVWKSKLLEICAKFVTKVADARCVCVFFYWYKLV